MALPEAREAAARRGEGRAAGWLLGRLTALWPVVAVVAIAGAAHAANMFRAPMYDDDEGLYMQQAWSFATSGKLSPYTYFYDHPPLGWLTIAAWAKLSGGFTTFGASVNSGRALMLIAHIGAAALLWGVARRAGAARWASALAVGVFALSPFQILYGREVLLDNLAVFWTLLALWLMLRERLSLAAAAASGAALGIALLNKEIVGLLIPGMLLLLWGRFDAEVRWKGLMVWLVAALAVAALYPLRALAIGEFFPQGAFLDYRSGPHPSLLTGIRYQFERARDRGVFGAGSEFWDAARIWWRVDPALAVAAGVAIPFGALLWRRTRDALGFAVMLGLFMLFLGRGGAVFDFWLLPAVPLIAVLLALAADAVADAEWRGIAARAGPALRRAAAPAGAALLATVVVTAAVRAPAYARSYDRVFTQDQTAPERQAVDWIKANVSRNAIIVTDNYAWVDLRGYAHADSFWRVDSEPSIREDLLQGDGRNIDYVVLTPVMKEALDEGKLPLVAEAVADAQPAVRFERDGMWVEILRINK